MAAKDLGTKYVCFKCGAKFYDMKRPEPICPKCGADQRENVAPKTTEKTERKRLARAIVDEPVLDEEIPEEESVAEEEEEEEMDEIPEEDSDDDR